MSDADPPDNDPFSNHPSGENNPFKGVPIFGDLANILGQQGTMSWDAARQFALSIATGGTAEPNVEPLDRMKIEQLARVAELRVGHAAGLEPSPSGQGISIVPVNRTAWAHATLDAYRPLFEVLARSLHDDVNDENKNGPDELDASDPFGVVAPLMKMLGPMMLGLTAGSMVGHLAQRCFGQYDLPIPRPRSDELMLCVPNLDAFGAEWSLPPDDLRLWVCLHEVTYHAVLNVPHVREHLERYLSEYLAGFEPDPGRLESALGSFEMGDITGPDSFQQLLADPEVVLGAIQSPAQRELLPRLEALVCTIVGFVDYVMDEVGATLLSDYAMLTEALRRRRVEAAASDRFVERLFGLELTQAAYDRGNAFIHGVVKREGKQALSRLWRSERELATPAEIDAPGLWLARIDLPS